MNGGPAYSYDPFGMMISKTPGPGIPPEYYVYTAEDERLAINDGVHWNWSFRDLDGKVLRQYQSDANTASIAWL